MIRSEGGKFCVYSKDGKESFGCYDSEQEAHARLAEIHRASHGREDGGDTVTRLDFSGPLGKAKRTPQGFLRVPANLTRVGVLKYRNADGTIRRELRHPDEVFKADSVASLSYAPVTKLHPPGGWVDPSNVQALRRGTVAENVQPSARFLAGEIIVEDSATIGAVERGELKELSPGYTCKLDATPGEWEGEPYDAIQRGIVYNHVALGPSGWGRSGAELAIRADSSHGSETLAVECRTDSSTHEGEEGNKMELSVIRFDGVDFEVAKKDAPHLERALAAVVEKTTAVEAKLAEETKRADAAEAKVKELAERAPQADAAAVAARVALEKSAAKVAGDDFKCDGLSDHELRCAVVKAKREGVNLDGKGAEYVSALFDVLVEEAAKTPRADSREQVRKVADALRGDGTEPEKSAQARYTEASRNAWKTPALATK